MKENEKKDDKQYLIVVKLNEYNKAEFNGGAVIYMKQNKDGSEHIIDNNMSRLVHSIYDDLDRCIEVRIFTKAFDYDFNVDSEQPIVYSFLTNIIHSYLGEQPYPFRSKNEKFWVANKYDKDNNLLQSVTSMGSTLQQIFEENALVKKKFRIKQDDDTIKDYVYTFQDDNPHFFVEYEDSDGNFWNEGLGFDCPFENPVQIRENFTNNNDFL